MLLKAVSECHRRLQQGYPGFASLALLKHNHLSFSGIKKQESRPPRTQTVLCMAPGTYSKGESRAQEKGPLPLDLTGELAAAFDILSLVRRVGVRCFVLARIWAPLAFASKKDPEVPDTSVTPRVFWWGQFCVSVCLTCTSIQFCQDVSTLVK